MAAIAAARDDRSIFAAPMSGTSSAAATTSAVAAVVWGEHPSWGPRDLMRHLVDSGTELPDAPADACYFGVRDHAGCGSGRRISMRRALGLPSAARAGAFVDLAGASDRSRPIIERRADIGLGSSVHPQPGKGGCGSCTLSFSTDTFSGVVDSTFWSTYLPDSVILHLVWTDGTLHSYQFALTGQQFSQVVPGAPAWVSAAAQFTATLPSPHLTDLEQIIYVQ